MKRFIKYRDAREYAQRLALADNLDVADFAKDFLDALDEQENVEEDESIEILEEIEKLIEDKCPEYEDWDTEKAVEDMISRLRPKLEYDL